jgi:uncharacterized membrane protein (DUF106 family)
LAFSDFLTPVLSPLLDAIGVVWFIVLLSACLSLLITVIYKYATNQKEMKALKDELKELQGRIKKQRDDHKKMMETQREAMQKNMQYMKHSLKATLFTFIPLILIFGWLNLHLTYVPIFPSTSFNTTAVMDEGIAGEVTLSAGNIATSDPTQGIKIVSPATQEITKGRAGWELMAEEGEYFLEYDYEGTKETRYVIVTKEFSYRPPQVTIKDSPFRSLNVEHQKLKLLNIFGWRIGWLGVYIIISIITSILFRKLLKVY